MRRTMETQVALEVLLRPLPLVLLLVTILAAVSFGGRLARRLRSPHSAGILFIASVGAAAALTSIPDTRGALFLFAPHGGLVFLWRFLDPSQVIEAITSPLANTEQFANVLLYVPIGLTGFALLRSSAKSVGFAGALTVVMETWQGFVNRSADLADVRNNVLGAVLGTLLGHAVALIMRRNNAADRWIGERATRPLLVAAGVTVVLFLGLVTVPPLWYRITRADAGSNAAGGAATVRTRDELLNDVRIILDAQNSRGVSNFSYLPRRPPPNLARMLIAKASEPVVDSYEFGNGTIYAYLQYSPHRMPACTGKPQMGSSEFCVQDREIHPAGASGAPAYVSVRIGTSTGATPDLEDPATQADTAYWADAELVPMNQAIWFTDLATRSRVSATTK